MSRRRESSCLISIRNYPLPIEQTQWHLPGHGTEVVFKMVPDIDSILAKADEDGGIRAADAATRAGEIAIAVVEGGR